MVVTIDSTRMDEPNTLSPKNPKVAPIVVIGMSVLSVGVVFYHHVENLKWLDALYFSVITLTTVGYGDIVPTTDAAKLFTVFYVLIGVGIIAATANYLLRRTFTRRIEIRQERHERKKERKTNK